MEGWGGGKGWGDGDYLISYVVNASLTTTASLYTVGVYDTGTLITESQAYLQTSNVGNWQTVGATFITTGVTSGDYFDLRFTNATNTRTLTLRNVQFTMNRISR